MGAPASERSLVGYQQWVLRIKSQSFCSSFIIHQEFRHLPYVRHCAGYMAMKDTVLLLRENKLANKLL